MATHQVNPLLAYDQNGSLLEPQDYAKCLEGATVVIYFELNHYVIHQKDEHTVDTFRACITKIRVILPPETSPATPQRKKVLLNNAYPVSFTPNRHCGDDNHDDKESEQVPG